MPLSLYIECFSSVFWEHYSLCTFIVAICSRNWLVLDLKWYISRSGMSSLQWAHLSILFRFTWIENMEKFSVRVQIWLLQEFLLIAQFMKGFFWKRRQNFLLLWMFNKYLVQALLLVSVWGICDPEYGYSILGGVGYGGMKVMFTSVKVQEDHFLFALWFFRNGAWNKAEAASLKLHTLNDFPVTYMVLVIMLHKIWG